MYLEKKKVKDRLSLLIFPLALIFQLKDRFDIFDSLEGLGARIDLGHIQSSFVSAIVLKGKLKLKPLFEPYKTRV